MKVLIGAHTIKSCDTLCKGEVESSSASPSSIQPVKGTFEIWRELSKRIQKDTGGVTHVTAVLEGVPEYGRAGL